MKRTTRVRWCPGWESNPHEEKSPEDFKSSASAIPPPGPWHYKLIGSKQLKQHRYISMRMLNYPGVSSDVSGGFCANIQTLDGSQCMLWREMAYETAGKRVAHSVPTEVGDLRILLRSPCTDESVSPALLYAIRIFPATLSHPVESIRQA